MTDKKIVKDIATFPGDYLMGGYHQRNHSDYDKNLCLVSQDVLDFVLITQPNEWDKLKKSLSGDIRPHFLERVNYEIKQHGTLHVLRKGIKDLGCKFHLAYFPPATGLNPEIQKKYHGNIFSVIRQLKYSENNENSLDLCIFLNGLPIFTVELKDPLTGQSVENAITQYRSTRDPKEPLFAYRRCLAHFAVDPELVYFTTRLEGSKTRFIPFNQGNNLGAGNPPSWNNFPTAYLWEQIWARDSVLNLIQYFIHEYEEEDEEGNKTGKRILIFPRYHQLDSVRRIINHAKVHGSGQHYLIQHSAGSGKSNSIAWLSHQLSVLHNAKNERVFDSVVVITDRRVLDRQLQSTVRQFEQTLGTVETITENSQQLKMAMESGKNIIVTTLQKFQVISEQVKSLPGKNFAVIIDEAHSSQSGEATRHLNTVLSASSLEEAEKQEAGEIEEDIEDRIEREIRQRGQLSNVSYFAFTATPKTKTLELFGTKVDGGGYQPFSLYPMRQAIEEGFILDVLQNYTTYKAYWSLLKKVKDDPTYDRNKAVRLMMSFVDMHEHTIGKKVEVIVEHFRNQTQSRIGGHAKAMVVTRSRLHAVRYKQAIDSYMTLHGYPFKSLVAFSGKVDNDGVKYTESGMNGFPETKTAQTFKLDEYKFLIVAEKFQTGFDQPLLHTMYVDKKLKGIHAVQTLSRLNRVHPGKEETFVLDFANEADDIQKSFEPYYEKTILSEATDPNLLYDLQTKLEQHGIFSNDEINQFANQYFSSKGTQAKLFAALQPAITRFKAKGKDEQIEFRGTLSDFVRLYAFLSQIVTFSDPELEKLYAFGRFLLRRLPIEKEKLPLEIQQSIDLESYRLDITGSGKITLNRGQGELKPEDPLSPTNIIQPDIEALSSIIKELNERFGTDFTEEDRLVIRQLEENLAKIPMLEQSIRVNTPENAMMTFREVVEQQLQDMIDTNFKFYKQVNANPDFAQTLTKFLFDRYRKGLEGAV
ncbi:restriction endonuclease subunit R [Leptolinea tardivitalis]|uniref:Restriction endonuclease subunit R n=1 Tax=Leptolinea tardivitalis TaxID=229920 RepID=A0A0P6XM57_9CHLR|nr:restriction endonuclease subunit R [Leptolinea tardivitalis]